MIIESLDVERPAISAVVTDAGQLCSLFLIHVIIFDAADVSLETEGQVATPPNSSPKREEKPSPDSAVRFSRCSRFMIHLELIFSTQMSHSDDQAELEDLMARMCTKDVRFDQLLNQLLQLLDVCEASHSLITLSN